MDNGDVNYMTGGTSYSGLPVRDYLQVLVVERRLSDDGKTGVSNTLSWSTITADAVRGDYDPDEVSYSKSSADASVVKKPFNTYRVS